MRKRLPFIIAAIIATFFIFGNSLQNSVVSSESSGRFVAVCENILSFFGIFPKRDMLVKIVRKTAHVSEFTLQGILLANCFDMPYKRRIVYILFLGLLTACTDEYIQLFSPGRAGLVQDVFIDFAGTLIGTAVAGISYKFRRK